MFNRQVQISSVVRMIFEGINLWSNHLLVPQAWSFDLYQNPQHQTL